MRMADLKPGWPVLGNDGRRLGVVTSVGQHYVQTSRSGRAGDLYVPASAIANVDAQVVHLNVPVSDAERMAWEQPPRASDELQRSPEADLDRHV